MAKRKRSKIDRLDPEFKSTVEDMIISNHFSYGEIAEFIHQNTGQTISRQAVCTHAKGLCKSLDTLRLAQENFKSISQELDKYPNLDTTEGIIKIMSNIILDGVLKFDEDDLQNTDPLKLMKQATELIRVAAYKKNLDLKNKDIFEAGFDAVKDKFFTGLAQDNPALYQQLSDYLDSKKSEITEAGQE